MNEALFRRCATPLLWIGATLFCGFGLGSATVHGMATDRYGYRALAPDTGSLATEGGSATAPGDDSGCDGCSERDLGYRWALLRRIGSSADCPDDSWGFRRGCAAYARDMAGS